MPRSKRYTARLKLVDRTKRYSLEDAIALVQKTNTAKFAASLEAHCNLGIDPKNGEQQVRSTVNLPHGTGKTKRIAAFVPSAKEAEAKDAGADVVGGKELIDQIKSTEAIAFDVAVATPDMMRELASIAKILGPRGLMPSPRNGTVTKDIGSIVHDLKGGMVTFKNDDTGNLHQVVGRVSWDAAKLRENLIAFLDAVRRAKPPSSKGIYLKSVTLKSTMGPGVRVQIS